MRYATILAVAILTSLSIFDGPEWLIYLIAVAALRVWSLHDLGEY